MKIQKLTIHNVASIEDATIDFETSPLADSEVFLITGKTGAGKSTILDAICLALYADTPRLDDTKMEGGTKDVDKSISIDDPRQLMRRNTAEAWVSLTFVGNNGVHYKAIWSVARANKKITGNLQRKDWSWENLDKGTIVDKDVEIKAEIKVAIGLDFDQFCRTTLLAQGEFTRFLNSRDEEKAKILEKITGVDVYSKIGAKVFEVTSQKKQAWETAQQLVEGTHTLSEEEILTKQEEVQTLDAQYEASKQQLDQDKTKLQWIKDDAEYTTKLASATKEKEEAVAKTESEDFKDKVTLVGQWNETIEARNWMIAKQRAENNKTQQQNALLSLKSNFVCVLEGLAFAEQEKRNVEAKRNELPEVKPEIQEQIATQLKDLRNQRDRDKELLQNIATVFERREIYAREKERKAKAAKALEESKAVIEKKQQEMDGMEPKVHDAKVKMDACKEVLDKQSDTIHKFAQTLRQRLQVGDICPVCRQEIKNELPHEDELNQLVESLSKSFAEAEMVYNDIVAKKNKLSAELQADIRSFNTAKENYDNDRSVADAVKRVVDGCKACGVETIDENTPKVLEALKSQTEASLKGLNAKIEELEEKTRVCQKMLNQRQLLDLQLSKITDTCKMTMEVVEDTVKLVPDWKPLSPAVSMENPDVLRKANEVQRKTSYALAQLKQADDAIAENGQQLEAFLIEHPDINMERLSVLNGYSSQTIGEMNALILEARNKVLTTLILTEEAAKTMEEHRRVKPELTEDDGAESLALRIANGEKTIHEIIEKKGAANQELRLDEQNKKHLGQLIADAEKKRNDYLKWARMNQFIGDSTGNKFRKIAQSYVLSSLIYSANGYMKTLTDRYTLKVIPGTFVILIEDAYQGYASRAASTISGGESFLVSLSLALALSDIGQRLAVDTLFIDEGFGTLSGEPLQNAVNTLRTLHNKAGRHVGIISHVEELKEQIPVQIQVNQEGNESKSSVVVVS